MVLFEFPPGAPFSEYVRTYRIVRFEFNEIASDVYKPYPPRPEHCLSFYPRDCERVEYAESGKKPKKLQAVLFGQQTEVTYRYVGKDFLLFQIVFRPGALHRLIGLPMQEITNEYLDAELFFKSAVREVNEQLNECGDFAQMIHVVNKFLMKQMKRRTATIHRVDMVNDLILNDSFNKTIDWLACESCLSIRQFERVFVNRMGVSPKYFAKVARFENAFRMKNKYPHLDWLTIAIHCGYYDYQLLVKDYKSITKTTPNRFHEIDLSSPERTFGQADTY